MSADEEYKARIRAATLAGIANQKREVKLGRGANNNASGLKGLWNWRRQRGLSEKRLREVAKEIIAGEDKS